MNRDKTKDRLQIQCEYIDWYIAELTLEDLRQVVYDHMKADLDMLDDEELVQEVRHYAPELVDNITLAF